MMSQDPIVEEVRAYRDAYARQFNYDVHAICADLRAQQRRSGRKIVSLPAKPAHPAAVSRSLGD